MTTEEIKTLIDQKIAGQGTMVDAGGALPTILKEIVDMAGQGGGGTVIKLTAPFDNHSGYTKTQMAALIGVSEADLDVILEGAADTILEVTHEFDEKGTAVTRKSFLHIVLSDDTDSSRHVIYTGCNDGEDFRLWLIKTGDEYSIQSTYAPTV